MRCNTIWNEEKIRNYVDNESEYQLLEFLEEPKRKAKIKVIDSDGYLYLTSVCGIIKNKEINVKLQTFFRNNPYTNKNIDNFIKINNLKSKVLKYPEKSKDKMELLCLECGNIYTKHFGDFMQKQICQECSRKKLSEKQRHDVSMIINNIENVWFDRKMKVLECDYKNNNSRILLQDNEGYKYYSQYHVIRSRGINKGFPSKTRGNKFACYNISLWMSKNTPNLKLVTKEYDESGSVLIECENGHISSITLAHLYERKRCPECNRYREIDLNIIVGEFLEFGYIVDEEKTIYKNNTSRIYFTCPKHGKQSLRYCNFQQGARCRDCWIERYSGEKNPNWNPDKTDEQRAEERKYNEYSQWRNSVFKKDDYTCQCCDVKGGNLNVHHKDGYHWCEWRRLDVSNGATLCDKCHYEFHQEYGYKNNTEAQYEKFIKSRR